MKHKALSMLLTLVMVVSLLPIAAVADTTEENTGAKEPIKKEDTVEWKPDDGPQVLCEENGTTYYLGVGDIDGEESCLFGPRSSCELSSDEDTRSFAFSAQVFTRDGNNYIPVNAEKRVELGQKYSFVLEIRPKASCIGYYYPEEENGVYRFTTKSPGDWIIRVYAGEKTQEEGIVCTAQLTVSLKRTLPNGILGMSYDGSDYRNGNFAFTEGVYEVQLAVGNRYLNSDSMLSANNVPGDEKLTYGGAVRIIKRTGGSWWRIRIEEGEQTTGWIQYGTDENNRVTITVKPSHGGAVDKGNSETKIYKQGSMEFKWASWGTVFPFEWHDETYCLGTAAWSLKLPYAQGGRGVNEAEDYYAACVFSLKSGEVGSANATYELREDIRAAMTKVGYRFELTLVPTDIGCDYYPITRTVEKTFEQQGKDGTKTFTSEWQGQKFSKDSVGLWVYDARVIKPNGEQLQRNLSCCKYSYTTKTTVSLEGSSVEGINQQIRDAIGNGSEQAGNGLYGGMITFILPSGELEGQIVIPETDYMITVYGNDYGRGKIATTLKGGIRFDNNNTNHVGFIHFIGAGKDEVWANAEKKIYNEAVYGIGQGTPEICIFEGYDIAIHSTVRPSWGSQDSIYLNNNVAICQNSDDGGQTIMRNNWFIGNNIAVMLKKSVPVNYLMNFRNRFINNGSDICNETGRPFDRKTGSVLWASENFFYHGPWNPERTDLWDAREDGAICLNFRNNNLIVAGAPSYAKTEDGWNDYLAYKAFLPRFGGWTPVYAYPLATSQYCDEMFYPNWRAPDFCPRWWPDSDPYYPSYVRQGETISENELDGLRLSSYDSASDTAVGTFEFSASAAETEN